jgi:hypothetical protein
MPLRFPVVQEVARHASVCHLPVNDAVLVDLLDDGLCHKKAGTYTGCLAHNMHNRPERASFDGGTGEL